VRAARRCGKFLKQFDGRDRPKENSNGTEVISQTKAAADAGFSKDQQTTAVRVANVPAETFDGVVESDAPPTVTNLAEMGKATRSPEKAVESAVPLASHLVVANRARAAAERIRGRMQLAAESIIEVGRELIEQKAALGHGNFLPWIEAEFGMTDQTNWMNTARRYADKIPNGLEFQPPTVLYALAAPSTPVEVRETVESLVADGQTFTAKNVVDLSGDSSETTMLTQRCAAEGCRRLILRRDTANAAAPAPALARMRRQQINSAF